MDIFIIRVIASFLVGGLIISLQTIIAEHVPIKWRGPVLTVPSTMAIGFLFIGLTKSSRDVVEAATFFPAALAPDYIFVFSFAFLSRRGITSALAGSYLLWAVSAAILLKFPPQNFISSTTVYALPIIGMCYLLVRRLPQLPLLRPVPFSLKLLFGRSMVGGSIAALTVLVAKYFGNHWGGLFSAFPAAFTSTLLIYYSAHGKQLIPSVAKSLFFPGVFGFILYALIAALSFVGLGIWTGTVICYVAVFVFYACYTLLIKYK